LFQQLCYALFLSTKLHKHIFENVGCTVRKKNKILCQERFLMLLFYYQLLEIQKNYFAQDITLFIKNYFNFFNEV